MNVANGVEMLELSANVMGQSSVIHPTLISDKDTVILVDAGFPGQLPKIREAVENAGVNFNRLSKIIITHHDIDHIGSLSAIVNESPQKVEVFALEGEKPYIQGEQRPVKWTPESMSQLDARLNALPEEQRRAIKAVFENFKAFKSKVDRTVSDGEYLPYCGGITVIHTPGHTPGHSCLYLKESKTLIAGDAMFAEDGKLIATPQFVNFDNDLAIKSLKKLTQYDIETVICYHGGLCRDNTNQRIAELARG